MPVEILKNNVGEEGKTLENGTDFFHRPLLWKNPP
jgi:hypothetical protein